MCVFTKKLAFDGCTQGDKCFLKCVFICSTSVWTSWIARFHYNNYRFRAVCDLNIPRSSLCSVVLTHVLLKLTQSTARAGWARWKRTDKSTVATAQCCHCPPKSQDPKSAPPPVETTGKWKILTKPAEGRKIWGFCPPNLKPLVTALPPWRRPRGVAAPFPCARAAFVRMIKNVTGSPGYYPLVTGPPPTLALPCCTSPCWTFFTHGHHRVEKDPSVGVVLFLWGVRYPILCV